MRASASITSFPTSLRRWWPPSIRTRSITCFNCSRRPATTRRCRRSRPQFRSSATSSCRFFLGLASAILFLINCSAFILYGVTALFGPIFVPLLMTKTFRAKFFHFLDVLISFAMIRAVAAAFIFVWAGFMNAFIQQTFNGNYSMEMWLANLIPCMMVFIAFIINMLFIPSMTQAIFGGAAGLAAGMHKIGWRRSGDCSSQRRRCIAYVRISCWLSVTPQRRVCPQFVRCAFCRYLSSVS